MFISHSVVAHTLKFKSRFQFWTEIVNYVQQSSVHLYLAIFIILKQMSKPYLKQPNSFGSSITWLIAIFEFNQIYII